MLMRLLWAKQSWLSWPFLICEIIQFLKHLHGPSLISVQYVLVSFILGEPSFGPSTPVFVTSAEWRKRIASLNPLAVLCLMQSRVSLAFVTERTHCWLVFTSVSTRTPGTFPANLLSRRVPPVCVGAWVVPLQIQDIGPTLADLYQVPGCPFVLPALVPLDGSMTLWPISHSSQCLSFANLRCFSFIRIA